MVAIIDYKMGNVGSVLNALNFLGFEAKVTSDADEIKRASHIILPGVGAFGEGMFNLKKANILEMLNEEVKKKKKPFLGICLGMQMLAKVGEEGGKFEGIGWVDGITRRFNVDEKKNRIPHIGWNEVKFTKKSTLFKSITKPFFYFVHSYFLDPKKSSVVVGKCMYGENFAASIELGNIFGVQFHPEKSQSEGLKILENFINFES